MRDASLDEFLADTDERDGDPGGEADDGGPDGAGGEPEPEPEPEPGSGAGAGAGTGTAVEAGGEPGAGPEGPPPADDVESARSTFAWSPDGVACADCGERVKERWESDAGLVCNECKEW